MSGFEIVKIGELGRVITGRTPPTARPELLGMGAAFITPTDIADDSIYASPTRRLSAAGEHEFQRVMLPANSVCYTCIASIGKMCLTREPSLTNQQINSIVVDQSRFDAKWVFYALRAMRDQIEMLASGSATRIINKTVFSSIEVHAPPPPEQRRIGSILGAYDDLIEVNRRRLALLEKMAGGLYEEWFVRFRFPGHENVAVTDTSRGPLPRGWEWRPFSALAEFRNGFAFKPSDFQPEGLPIVKIPELKDGVLNKTPRNSGENVPRHLHIHTGDLLFSWSGTFAISEWTWGPALLNQHLFLVTPVWDVGQGFIKQALIQALPRFDSQGVGATMKHIRRSALDTTYVATPDDPSLLVHADRYLQAHYDHAVLLKRQTQSLAAARDLLLPRLISGQLSLDAAERELEEAA